MKLCFSTLGCHDKTLQQIIVLAQRHSISALEVRGISGEMKNSQIKDFSFNCANETKGLLKRNGIEPLILGTSCKFHDDETRNKMIENAYDEIVIAKRMGFKAIRVFGNNLTENKAHCIDEVAKALSQVCQFAKRQGIEVYLEVHGDFNTVEVLQELIEQMESLDSFGLIWDVGHTHKMYGKNWSEFYQAMKPYICHVHIKDLLDQNLVLPGNGEIEITEIMKTLLEDGYEGWFSLEWERKWFPELPTLDDALKKFNELIRTME